MKNRMALGLFAGILSITAAWAEEGIVSKKMPVVPSAQLNDKLNVTEVMDFKDSYDRRGTASILFFGRVKSTHSKFPAQLLSTEDRITNWGEYVAGPFRVKTQNQKAYRIAFTEQSSQRSSSNDCYVVYRADELGTRYSLEMDPVRVAPVDCAQMRQLIAAAEGPELASAHSLTAAGRAELEKLQGRWTVHKKFDYALQFAHAPENPVKETFEFDESFAIHLSSKPTEVSFIRTYKNTVHSLPNDLTPAQVSGDSKDAFKGFVIRERTLENGLPEILLIENPLSWNWNEPGNFRFSLKFLKDKIAQAHSIDDFMPTQAPGVCGENVTGCSDSVALFESSESVSGSAMGLRMIHNSQGQPSLLITGYDRDSKTGEIVKTSTLTVSGDYSEQGQATLSIQE